ncbi:MAG: LysE family transporter, partial [Amphritea sp.]|nr:LysE family transporter [Amphritea sp.]
MSFESAITFFIAIFIFGITPGPGVFAILAKAMVEGSRRCFMLALGMVLSDILYLTLACLGLATIAERNNSDNFDLNIKIKEGEENFWFGNVNAGGGYSTADKGLYLLQPKIFYYSPKFTFNFIGDVNNIGEVVLTRRDLRNFGGGFRAPSRASGTDLNLGNNDLSFLTSQDDALAVENILGATNFSWAVNRGLDISGFAIFNSSLIDSKQRSITQYTDSDLGIPNEITDQTSQERS